MSRIKFSGKKFVIQGLDLNIDQNAGTMSTNIEFEEFTNPAIGALLIDDFKYPVVSKTSTGLLASTIYVFAIARVRCINGSKNYAPPVGNQYTMYDEFTDQLGHKLKVDTGRNSIGFEIPDLLAVDYHIVSCHSHNNGASWSNWQVVMWNRGYSKYFAGAPAGERNDIHDLRVVRHGSGFVLGFVAGRRSVFLMKSTDGASWTNRQYVMDLQQAYGANAPGSLYAERRLFNIVSLDTNGDGSREQVVVTRVYASGRIIGGCGYHVQFKTSTDLTTWTQMDTLWTDGQPMGLAGGRKDQIADKSSVGRGIAAFGRRFFEKACPPPWVAGISKAVISVVKGSNNTGYIGTAPLRAFAYHLPTCNGTTVTWQRSIGVFGLFQQELDGIGCIGDVKCMTIECPPPLCPKGIPLVPHMPELAECAAYAMFYGDVVLGTLARGSVAQHLGTSLIAHSGISTLVASGPGLTLADEPYTRDMRWYAANGYVFGPWKSGYFRVAMSSALGPSHFHQSRIGCCPGYSFDEGVASTMPFRPYEVLSPSTHAMGVPDWFSASELDNSQVGLAGCYEGKREPLSVPFSGGIDNELHFDWWNIWRADNALLVDGSARPTGVIPPDNKYFVYRTYKTDYGPLIMQICRTKVWVRTENVQKCSGIKYKANVEAWLGPYGQRIRIATGDWPEEMDPLPPPPEVEQPPGLRVTQIAYEVFESY